MDFGHPILTPFHVFKPCVVASANHVCVCFSWLFRAMCIVCDVAHIDANNS